MGNCATCCGKADTHEVDTTEKKNHQKLKAESGYGGGEYIGAKKGYGGK
jgi:hypothetical protein